MLSSRGRGRERKRLPSSPSRPVLSVPHERKPDRAPPPLSSIGTRLHLTSREDPQPTASLTSFFTNTMGRLLRGHSATIRRLLYQRICFSASLRQDEPPWVVIEWSQSDDIWSRKEQAGSPSSMVLCGTYWGWKREGDHPIIFIDISSSNQHAFLTATLLAHPFPLSG